MTFGVIKVDSGMLEGKSVDPEDIAETLEDMDERWVHLRQSYWPTDEAIQAALTALPAVLESDRHHDSGLPVALQYYRLSTSEYAFLGDRISEVLSGQGPDAPTSALDRQRVENAFHNSFKAIEALIGGEPGKTIKVRRRLLEVGIDP